MRLARFGRFVAGASTAVLVTACGGSSPTQPRPPVTPPPVIEPPANAAPTIESVSVQGRRPKEPARFADLKETVDVTASVRDPETPPEEMTYHWTATAGSFSGTGRTVTWTAPDSFEPTPAKITLTVRVVEHYGHPGQPKNYSQEVSATVDVALHNSLKEVGDMARQFLNDFSNTTIKDWRYILRDFSRTACPDAGEIDLERTDVENHYTYFVMHNYRVDSASVAVNFGGLCSYLGKRGDACASVGVFWDSTDVRTNVRKQTAGIDHLTANYSTADTRWWLCSSYFQPTTSSGHLFYSR